MDFLLQELRRAGYRITDARRAIVQALVNASRPLNPQELYEAARVQHPRVGLVTVYRTLEALLELGMVQKVHGEQGCVGYVYTGRGHRHVAWCRACGRAFIFEGQEDLSSLEQSLERTLHFRVEGHLLQLTGLCAECQART
ncbi:MAG: transcriptional repressor [Chloroflexi bacterium]|nr:transcriptional repressor [Chloroflexota bacterium]